MPVMPVKKDQPASMENLSGTYVKIMLLEAAIIVALWWFGRTYS